MVQKSSTSAPLGQAVRQARNALRLSVRELARRADIPHTQISRIESGQIKKPSREALVSIAKALEQNPMPLLILAGHLDRDEARAALRPFFREGAELVEDWRHWEGVGKSASDLTLARAQTVVRDPKATEDQLARVAAELFGYYETVETEWDDSYVLAAAHGRPKDQAQLREFLEVWGYIGSDLRDRWLMYGRRLREIADLEWQAEVQTEGLRADVKQQEEAE